MTTPGMDRGESAHDGDEERFIVRPRERRFPLRGGYVFVTDAGETLGEYRLHIVRPSEFRGPADRLRFHQQGFLVPRFTVHDDTRELGALDYNLVTGAMDLIVDGTRVRVEREGLLRQRLHLVDEDGHVPLRMDASVVIGGETRVTLRPGAAWTRRRLIALAALIVHARVRVRVLVSAGFGGLAWRDRRRVTTRKASRT